RSNVPGDTHLYSTDLSPESMQWALPLRRDTATPPISTAFDFQLNPSGEGILVWTQAPDNQTPGQVWVSTRNSVGAWTEALNISSTAPGSENSAAQPLSPSLDEDGNFYLAWLEGSLWMSRRPASGSWTAPSEVPVTAPPMLLNDPPLAPLNDGEALLVVD